MMHRYLLPLLVALAVPAQALAQTCDVMRPCAAPGTARHAPRGHARPPEAPARSAAALATVTSSSGASARVAGHAAGAFRCLVSALEVRGYPVAFMGGYRARGSVRGSLHPAGLALDVNQYARGVTRPRMPRDEIALANSCGLISGAQWAHNDSGHFQLGGYGGGASRRGARRVHHRHHRPR